MLDATNTTPSDFMTSDHRSCDALWAEVEGHADADDAAGAQIAFTRFRDAMIQHFTREEEQLFPALEPVMGMPPGVGPVAVMRMEHAQMRGVLAQMESAAMGGDWAEMVDQGDTLLMLIQQHNVKEEAILYPMADRALGSEWQRMAQGWTVG